MESSETFNAFCERVGLDLEPFQARIVDALFSDQRELLVCLPRGQGKTTLLAALAVHHLLTVEEPAVYVAAASRDQARVLYEAARRFAERLESDELVIRHLELRVQGGHLRVLAADAMKLHGLTPSLSIVDELHAHKDDELYVAMRTAMHKRPGSRMVTISTAGQGADSPLGRLRQRALALPDITVDEYLTDARGPGMRMLDWSVPDKVETTPENAKRANPASWITLDALRDQREALPEVAWRRFHCNQWTDREGAWLPAGAWNACVGEPAFEDGERIWIGVDIGGERSETAVVWCNEGLNVGVEIFTGDHGVIDALDTIEELADRFQIAEVVYDPWRFGQGAQELEERGVLCVAFPQHDARMIPASARLHSALVEKRITLPDHPDLRRHAGNAIAKHSRRGWRLDKPSKEMSIDAIVALAMCVERAEHKPAPVEVVAWL